MLLPTLSYLAYANEHASWMHPIPATPGLDRILACVSERDRYMADNRLLSIYERHTDGSGVAYSSRRRPVVNMRHDLGMPLLQGGPHQFPADMELLRWLDGLGIAYDVVTDDDLHADGAALLEGYRVLLTGSHPEYWSGAMLDGLEAWQAGRRPAHVPRRQRLLLDHVGLPRRPHVLEVRRGHAGTGVWRPDPGEVHHASTGEPGGLWRFRGRPPQRVAGIGFTAQGFDASLPYVSPTPPATRAAPGSSRASRARPSAPTARCSAAPAGSRSTGSTPSSARRRTCWCWRSAAGSRTSTRRRRRTS